MKRSQQYAAEKTHFYNVTFQEFPETLKPILQSS